MTLNRQEMVNYIKSLIKPNIPPELLEHYQNLLFLLREDHERLLQENYFEGYQNGFKDSEYEHRNE